jgi:hypothetical protein
MRMMVLIKDIKSKCLLIIILFFMLFLFLLAGCTSIPEDKTDEDWMALLPQDASIYFYIRFSDATKEMIKEILFAFQDEDKNLKFLLKKTEKIFGALRYRGDEYPFLYTLLVGEYPATLIKNSLNREWIKEMEPDEFWFKENSYLEIGVPERHILMVSNGDMAPFIEYFKQPEKTPISTDIFSNSGVSELAAYVPDFTLHGFNEITGIPTIIHNIWVKADRMDEHYSISAHFILENEGSVKGFTSVLRLFLVYFMREGKIQGMAQRLKELEIYTEKNEVMVDGLILSYQELPGLIINLIEGND